MSVYFSEDAVKIEKQIESISNQYKNAEFHPVGVSSTTNGREWQSSLSLNGEISDNALFWLKIKTYALVFFTCGIAYYLFQSVKDNWEAIKTKRLLTRLYFSADTREAQIKDIHNRIFQKFEGRDGDEKVQTYRKQAEAGEETAQCKLGECYYRGINGLIENKVKAQELLKKATAQGNVEAEFMLGCCYNDLSNKEEAFNCFKKAADKGHLGAKSNLGICYINGIWVLKNPEEAVRLFEECVAGGHIGGKRQLAQCLINGWGIAVDKDRARALLSEAICAGDIESKYLLHSI